VKGEREEVKGKGRRVRRKEKDGIGRDKFLDIPDIP
jgi:hypothetical protein